MTLYSIILVHKKHYTESWEEPTQSPLLSRTTVLVEETPNRLVELVVDHAAYGDFGLSHPDLGHEVVMPPERRVVALLVDVVGIYVGEVMLAVESSAGVKSDQGWKI